MFSPLSAEERDELPLLQEQLDALRARAADPSGLTLPARQRGRLQALRDHYRRDAAHPRVPHPLAVVLGETAAVLDRLLGEPAAPALPAVA